MPRATDIHAATQRILNEFVLADCRLQDHPKLVATLRVVEGDALSLEATAGNMQGQIAPRQIPLDAARMFADCLKDRKFWMVPDTSLIPQDWVHSHAIPASEFRSFGVVPLLNGNQSIGVLAVASMEGASLSKISRGRLQLLAGLLAYVLGHIARKVHTPTALSVAVGKALTEVRTELGLSQAAVADRMGQSRIALSRWESGAQPPSFAPLARWCEALGVMEAHSPTIVSVIDITTQLLPLLRAEPQLLQQISPSQFEQLIAERLDRMGFDVTIPSATNIKDGGIDLIAVPRLRTVGTFLIAGQVKHHRLGAKTGRAAVDRLLSWKGNPFSLGLLVTNTGFTKDALWTAAQAQNRPFLRLRDFEDLKRWLQDRFWSPEEWRELPDEVELAPGLVVKIPRANAALSLKLWPLAPMDSSSPPLVTKHRD